MNTIALSPKTTPFGLIAWLHNTRIQLPLVHVETRFRVTAGILSVEMDQIFEQSARESLDVVYAFPLPGQAAVHRCEMIVNGRVVRAVVMEDAEAKRTVQEQKAKGHRTALVAMNRENLFSLQLGNLAPGDRVVIRFAYFEQLDRLGTQLNLRIPFSPGVRYIPGKPLLRANRGRGVVDDTDQVPDASLLTPPRIDASHPDAATLYLHGEFDAGEVELRTLSSPTHPVVVRPTKESIEVELCGEEFVPANDLVLRWQECATAGAELRSWSCAKDGASYALVQLRAPEISALGADDDYVQDIYFLVDRSGSMEGQKWVKCAEALHAFVRELGPRDRVWITCFESDFLDFSEAPMSRDALLADRGFLDLANIGTAGGTELLPALEHVLKVRQQDKSGNPARIVVITDGQVGNEPTILQRLKRPDAADVAVYCFGIDDAVNDAFLTAMARQSGGRCALMTPNDDIPAAVQRLAQALRRPVLVDVRLVGEATATDDAVLLPDLHAGEVTLLALRADNGAAEGAVQGRLPDGSPWSQRISFAGATESDAARLLWAKRRCRHLLAEGRRSEAIPVAIEHNIACEGASFVAWDESEIVSVANREVVQPSMRVGSGRASAKMMCASPAAMDMMMMEAEEAPMPMQAPAAKSMSGGFGRLLRQGFSVGGSAKLSKSAGPPTERLESLGRVSSGDNGINRPLTPAEDACFDAMRRYGRLDSILKGTPLGNWAHEFYDRLMAAGVNRMVANAVPVILYKWAKAVISRSREGKLQELAARVDETLAESVPPSTDKVMEILRLFVRENVGGKEGADLGRVLG